MKKVLIVGRGLLGKFLTKNLIEHDITLCSHQEWRVEWALNKYDAIINCAAIVGQGKCRDAGYESVIKANVQLADKIVESAEDIGARAILFSTEGVYSDINSGETEEYYTGSFKSESHRVSAHNLYVSSKLIMESVCADRSIVFRLSRLHLGTEHPNDLLQAMRSYSFVENRWQTLATPKYVLSAINACLKRLSSDDWNGIYNLSELEPTYLPKFARSHEFAIPILPGRQNGMTPAHCLDTTKASTKGMFDYATSND